MNIVIFSSSDFPHFGASENFVRLMSIGIFNLGTVNVKVVRFWGNKYNCINDTPLSVSNYLFNVPFKHLFFKPFEAICQILYIPFFLFYRRFILKEKIFLLYGMDRATFLFPFLFFSRIFGIKSFRIITEIYPFDFKIQFLFKNINIFLERIQIIIFDRFFDGIIVLSDYLRRLCLNFGVKSNKIIMIPHFIDLQEIESKTYSLNKSQLSDSKFVIGYCGSISLDNGILELLESFKILERDYPYFFKLLIIGEFPEDLKYLEIQNPNIVITGYLARNQVFAEMKTCNILINPRRNTVLASSGFPTKLGEYFSTGIPVISTNVEVIKYFFKDESCLLKVDAGSSSLLAEKILFTFNNYSKIQQVGIKGYFWAKNQLDFNSNAIKLINFINKKL